MKRTTMWFGSLGALVIPAGLWLAALPAPDAALGCDDAQAQTVTVIGADATPPASSPEVTPAPEAPAQPPRAPRVPRVRRAPDGPPDAGLDIPAPPALLTPKGWFGFGFECDECTAQRGPRDSAAVWSFGTLPRVYSVDLGGPAARAGIRRGDVLTRIDGVSIITSEGGRRFGLIQPGQAVRWTVLRNGVAREVVARAAERPERRASQTLLDLRGELGRLNDLKDSEQLRREMSQLYREMERSRVRDEVRSRVDVQAYSGRRLRYAGVIAGTEVEVRGPGSVIVSESRDKNEVVITLGESVVRIRVPEGRAKRAGDTPR